MSDETGATDHETAWQSPRWWRLCVKELREILRDRRTIITLVAMPLLIYPLLGVTLQKLIMAQLSAKAKVEYRVALSSRRDEQFFRDLYARGNKLMADRDGRTIDPMQRPQGTIDDPFVELLAPEEDESTDIGSVSAGASSSAQPRE